MKHILILIYIFFVYASCSTKKSSKKEQQLSSIDSIEKVLFSAAANQPIDIDKGAIAVKYYLSFIHNFPNDSLASKYLFKAAEVSNSIKHYNEAVEYFNQFVNFYANDPKAPAALFLEAFIYENNLSNYGTAHKLYNQLINQYPKTQFASDAVACINNLGKSPEELIKEFEEKNKHISQ